MTRSPVECTTCSLAANRTTFSPVVDLSLTNGLGRMSGVAEAVQDEYGVAGGGAVFVYRSDRAAFHNISVRHSTADADPDGSCSSCGNGGGILLYYSDDSQVPHSTRPHPRPRPSHPCSLALHLRYTTAHF